MKSTYSVSELSSQAPAVLRQAEKRGSVTVCRNGRVVGFLLSRERMEAILETLEFMANPKAMRAIRDHEAGRTRFKDLSCLDED
jgi:PHD/YefM family antitoxin component YafN of YafNO toxin-antitoxin module